jgi:hypothetical protein
MHLPAFYSLILLFLKEGEMRCEFFFSGPCACETGILPLEPVSFFCFSYFLNSFFFFVYVCVCVGLGFELRGSCV